MSGLVARSLRFLRALNREKGAIKAGTDLVGNEYFYIPKTKEFQREARWVEYSHGGVGATSELAVEWQSWLVGQRKEPVPLEEQKQLAARRELIAARARGVALARERAVFAERSLRKEELKRVGAPTAALDAPRADDVRKPLKRRSGVDPTAGAGANFVPESWAPGK